MKKTILTIAMWACGTFVFAQQALGPGTGIVWDEETDTLNIASDWYADANGDIVRR